MSDDSYTVEMAINDWLADRKGVAQSTIDTARCETAGPLWTENGLVFTTVPQRQVVLTHIRLVEGKPK